MSNQPSGERRPIAARHTRWAGFLTNRLVAWGVTPNLISVAGLLAALAASACLAGTARVDETVGRWLWAAAGLLVPLRLLANMLDGMVAVASGKSSRLGELFNEVPDRLADVAILVGLGYAAGGDPTHGWAAALAALLVAYIRNVGKAVGVPHDFRGPMAKQQRMFLVIVCCWFMATAPAAWHPKPDLPVWTLALIIVGCIITFVRRLVGIGRHVGAAS